MSIISVVSPKGGAGKSTLAVTMATMFARLNVNVCVVDADPQQTVSHWYYGSNQNDEIKTSHKIHVIKNVREENFYEVVGEAANHHQIVIVDTSGRANLTMSRAIVAADLVLIPTKPSTIDMEAAINALKLINQEELGQRRKISHAIVLTEMPAAENFNTAATREFTQKLAEAKIPYFKVQLVKREAYRQMFYDRLGIDELPSTDREKIKKVVNNAMSLVEETVQFLRQSQKPQIQ